MAERFVFLDRQLVYVDAPFEGLVRSLEGDRVFAFRTESIVMNLVWHWVLLPVSSSEVEVAAAFELAETSPPHEWISIVEDRRGEAPRLYAACLPGSAYRVCR